MVYHIIHKIQLVNGSLNHTPIGYVESQEDSNIIDSMHYSSFETWVEDNRIGLESGNITPALFFDVHPVIYCGRHTTTDIEGLNLSLITDLNNPESV